MAKRVSDEAVKAKTGKVWAEWFAILDKAGAKEMAHKDIAKYLYEKQHVPGWWAQSVTVEYERERGLRKVHETASGFEASATKTLPISLSKLYDYWSDEAKRAKWLDEKGYTIRKDVPEKTSRLLWSDGKTTVVLAYYAKGPEKSQIAIQHSKLKDAKAFEKTKEYWRTALTKLERLVAK